MFSLQTEISVKWTGASGGWQDATAGIKEYFVEVWELTNKLGGDLREDPSTAPISVTKVDASTDDSTRHDITITLPSTG